VKQRIAHPLSRKIVRDADGAHKTNEVLRATLATVVVAHFTAPQSTPSGVGSAPTDLHAVASSPTRSASLSCSALSRYTSKVGAVCVEALVRICAGGDQRCSSLPRQLAGFRLGNRRNGIQELALSNFFQINRDRVSDFQPVEISLGPLSDGRADAHPRHLRSRNPAYKIKLFVTGYLDIVKSTVSLASKEFDRVDVFSFPPHHVHAP